MFSLKTQLGFVQSSKPVRFRGNSAWEHVTACLLLCYPHTWAEAGPALMLKPTSNTRSSLGTKEQDAHGQSAPLFPPKPISCIHLQQFRRIGETSVVATILTWSCLITLAKKAITQTSLCQDISSNRATTTRVHHKDASPTKRCRIMVNTR
eukprot:5642283-Amphidinium_carterae.1